jgi:cation:H+ antiporter
MFDGLGSPVLLGIFVIAAAVVWLAGVRLSNTTDVLSERLGLGQALGGVIVLAIATNLPEIAITVSAALGGNVDVAIGNILGGIALQTVVLAALDFAGRRRRALPLTARVGSLEGALSGLLVVAVLTLAILGHQFPPDLTFARLTPDVVLIAIVWLAGVWLLSKGRTGLPWQPKATGPEQGQGRERDRAGGDESEGAQGGGDKDQSGRGQQGQDKRSTARVGLIFGAAALATLVAGVVLERSGDVLANHFGLSGILFGATILAAATAIPELATGLTAVRKGEDELAIGDIFGGNAFLPVLFLLAGLITGQAILPRAQKSDIYLAAVGILLTVIYLYGLLFRPQRRVLGLGLDSLLVIFCYLLGIAGLFAVSGGG